MVVNLPVQPNGPTRLPEQPNDPPTLTDIANSVTYSQRLLTSHQADLPDSATSDDVARGEVYRTECIQAHAGADMAPAWFAPALARGLAPLTRVVSVTYNFACGDGTTRPFEVVPFVDGTLPTAHPHYLPALTNIHVIEGLSTGQQTTAYLVGYELPQDFSMNARKDAIRLEIGCLATFAH